jgi:hypothetical protein
MFAMDNGTPSVTLAGATAEINGAGGGGGGVMLDDPPPPHPVSIVARRAVKKAKQLRVIMPLI